MQFDSVFGTGHALWMLSNSVFRVYWATFFSCFVFAIKASRYFFVLFLESVCTQGTVRQIFQWCALIRNL